MLPLDNQICQELLRCDEAYKCPAKEVDRAYDAEDPNVFRRSGDAPGSAHGWEHPKHDQGYGRYGLATTWGWILPPPSDLFARSVGNVTNLVHLDVWIRHWARDVSSFVGCWQGKSVLDIGHLSRTIDSPRCSSSKKFPYCTTAVG